MSIDFFDDLIEYVLDAVMFDGGGDAKVGILSRISTTAEDIFEDVWDLPVNELEEAGETIQEYKSQAVEAVVDAVALLVQAAYETGGLDLATTIIKTKTFSVPEELPGPVENPVGLEAVTDNLSGNWRALTRLNDGVSTAVDRGSFEGSTADAREATSRTYDDLQSAIEHCDAWLSLIVEDLLSFGIVDNLANALGATKDFWQAEGLVERMFATLDAVVSVIKALLGIITVKVGLIASGSAAFIGGDLLATAASANEALVDSIVDGTANVDFQTYYTEVPAPDETIPAYEEFRDVLD